MMAEHMSFADFLSAECDLRERQRKERVKQEQFEKYAKEHGYIITTTNIFEQIKADLQKSLDDSYHFITKQDAYKEVVDIIDAHMKGEGDDRRTEESRWVPSSDKG